MRKKSDKKPGGQQERIGKGLVQVANTDVIATHTPSVCTGCGLDLSNASGTSAEQRQVFDGLLPLDILLQIERTYSGILADGFVYHTSLPPLPRGKRGKQKQRDSKNLLDRLKEKRDCVLLFIYDFSVDFTNN